MALLKSLIHEPHYRQGLVVFQSSSSQSSIPILCQFLSGKPCRALVFCLLHPPSSILENDQRSQIFDLRANVPGYATTNEYVNSPALILAEVEKAFSNSPEPTHVVIDSVDTLLSDIGSLSGTHGLLQTLLPQINARQDSGLLVHGTRTDLLSLIIQASFSSSLVHIKVHPPALLKHLAAEYLTPPPPLSMPAKFWGIFLPLSQRQRETDQLVFGTSGEGSGNPNEMIVEVLVRGVEGIGKKRGVERVLEAWSITQGACEWNALDCLKSIWLKQPKIETSTAVDPTQNLSFNLSLTASQQESRSQVPLPYAHEGQLSEKKQVDATAAIFYDPDSADDIDDDDPDEDLDI